MKYFPSLALGFWALLFISTSQAIVIEYTATDLTDINAGEDLWEYSYTVSDHTFSADTGFAIYFDFNLFDQLDFAPLAPNPDWDVITWAPDPFFGEDGSYDAYALFDSASLADPFTVSFVWLGDSTGPGAQNFELYDGFTFDILEEGNTSLLAGNNQPPSDVPEPATVTLMAFALWLIRRRTR